MDEALRNRWTMADQDQRIFEAIERDQSRLRNFIRKRVADQGDAEDILQDVFYELIEAYRMMKPVEQATAWLFRAICGFFLVPSSFIRYHRRPTAESGQLQEIKPC
jgi:hypothetical protein